KKLSPASGFAKNPFPGPAAFSLAVSETYGERLRCRVPKASGRSGVRTAVRRDKKPQEAARCKITPETLRGARERAKPPRALETRPFPFVRLVRLAPRSLNLLPQPLAFGPHGLPLPFRPRGWCGRSRARSPGRRCPTRTSCEPRA